VLETYLSWYREGRMDGSEFRAVIDHLARSGLTVEHPMLGCGMLLDVVGEQVKLPVERILDLGRFTEPRDERCAVESGPVSGGESAEPSLWRETA
jgi:hypothetical protein